MRLTWEKIRRSLGIPDDQVDVEAAAELGTPSESTTLGSDPTGGYQRGPDDGVYVAPTPITGRQEVTVSYSGLLARQGAREVFLHYGFGPGEWADVHDVPMQKVGERFETSFEVPDGGRLELCFHDASDNWDNNGGRNWSYIIHDGDRVP